MISKYKYPPLFNFRLQFRVVMKNLTTLSLLLIGLQSFTQELDRTIEQAHTGGVNAVAISSDESILLTGGMDKRVYLWKAMDGAKTKALSHTSPVNSVAYNNNNSLFATASADMKVIVFDGATGKPKRLLKGHSAPVTAIVYHPLNDKAATCDEKGEIRLWSESGQLINTFKGHSKAVRSIAFSPDGKTLVSGSDDGTIRYWNTENGQSISNVNSDSKSVYAVAVSNDGGLVASGGSSGNIELWNAVTGEKLTKLEGHKNDIRCIDFSSDVQYLASGSIGGEMIVWNMNTKQSVSTLEAHERGVLTVRFGAEGNSLVSGGGDGNMKIWNISSLNIGKRRFAKSGQSPDLSIEDIRLVEANENGLLEYTDAGTIELVVKNSGKGQAYNIMASINQSDQITGLTIQHEMVVGNLDKGSSRTITIPLATDRNLESGTTALSISLKDANGNEAKAKELSIQTKGESNFAYLMVKDVKYSSATGKAEVNAPITLTMMLQNTSKGNAKDIRVKMLLPSGVMAVDQLSQYIAEIPASGLAEVSFEFYAKEGYSEKNIAPQLIVQGAFSNIEDQSFDVALNEELPVNEDYGAIAMSMNVQGGGGEEVVYRGGGDPLMGLNVAKAKELVIGDYYALIIGIDDYGGGWTPLNNAVRDARAIETLLQSKYKFDHFKSLYNDAANRSNIIKEMEWLVENVKEQDNVFIYYSGHGEYKENLNKGYWVPVDAKSKSTSEYISNSDIQTFIGGIRSKHTLLVSDACFSGDIFRGNTVSVPFEDNDKYYTNVHNLVSRKAITSGGIEPVMDGGRDGHSVFAYYFLKSLRGNESKYIDAGKLYETIKVPVINNSEQTPQMAPVKNTGDEGGQFLFVRKQ